MNILHFRCGYLDIICTLFYVYYNILTLRIRYTQAESVRSQNFKSTPNTTTKYESLNCGGIPTLHHSFTFAGIRFIA